MRIKWLDFGKGITILGVVLVHDKDPIPLLGNLLLICVMPVFFAISGYLYKPTLTSKKYILMLYKKISSFLIPYIMFTLFLLFRRLMKHDASFIFTHNYFIPITYLWFLYSLFFIFVIVGIMDLLHMKLYIQLIISLLLMFIQMFLPWHMASNGDVNPFAGIGGYMICFLLGRAINVYDVQKFLKRNKNFLILFLLWLIISIFQIVFYGNLNEDMFYLPNFITKLLSIFVFFSLFMCFPHNKLFEYFTKYGKYTLVIYLVHFPVITVLKYIPVYNIYLKFIIVLLVAWYLSIFVCKLSTKLKIINFIFYTRGYINKMMMHIKLGKKLLKNM